MGKILQKCTKCNQYTMRKKICPFCGAPTANPRPIKFSLEDKYGIYRRRIKRRMMGLKDNNQ
ncbi:MAG: nucleolar RNA-binding Nop10p family protein [Candidatus Helarchaeota archaeon]